MNQNAEMPRCFLSYSENYRGLMELVRGILEELEFQVDVFDGPDIEHPPIDVVKQRIGAADCMVLLLGPIADDPARTDPAYWPEEEGIIASALKKPMAIILHTGTRVPQSLQKLQTPVRFNFWKEGEILRKVHHLLKHLIDLKRLVDLPSGDQPFMYTRALNRLRVHRDGTMTVHCYHEVVARQEWSLFHHAFDTGLDTRESAKVQLVAPDSYSVDVTLETGRHKAQLDIVSVTERQIVYHVTITPPLSPGERLGYRREFDMINCLPLSSKDLAVMASEPGFPALFRIEGRPAYGETFDVRYDLEKLTIELRFPNRLKVRVRTLRAVVVDYLSGAENRRETERCNGQDSLSMTESPDSDELMLALNVKRPLMNHRYALLYEPM